MSGVLWRLRPPLLPFLPALPRATTLPGLPERRSRSANFSSTATSTSQTHPGLVCPRPRWGVGGCGRSVRASPRRRGRTTSQCTSILTRTATYLTICIHTDATTYFTRFRLLYTSIPTQPALTSIYYPTQPATYFTIYNAPRDLPYAIYIHILPHRCDPRLHTDATQDRFFLSALCARDDRFLLKRATRSTFAKARCARERIDFS